MAVPTTRQTEDLVLPGDDQHPYESSPRPIDGLSTFLATYTTPLHYSQPESDGELFVFWSPTVRSENNLSSDDPGSVSDSPNPNPREIRQTIKSAFLELQHYPLDVLIQFWSPIKPGSITTYDQPFALEQLDSNRFKHRLCSLRYQYVIDANKLEVKDDPSIISGPPANAFLNHLAEVVLDLRVHQERSSPLMRSAIECGFMSYFVMPICHPSQRSCVGVVECFANNYDDLLEMFMSLADALQAVGLGTFHGQQYLPYKTIGGLKYAMDEIEVPLQKVCQSFNLSLAQVSIAYRDGNLASFEDKHMKPMLALKLVAPFVGEDDEDKWFFIDYCGSCDMVPLRIGEGLARKALLNYNPHFCRNIYEITNNDRLPATNTITKLSCLAICLRSSHTNNLDYVFEFLWPQYRNYFTMIEMLTETLKMWLPNFKFACGAQLGDDLPVINVGNSSTSALQDLMAFEGNLHVKRKCEGYDSDNWQRRKRMNRKHKDQSDMPDNVSIKVETVDRVFRCFFPSSSITFEAVRKEIALKLKLVVGEFQLTYRDEEDDLICMVDDDDVMDCLKSAIPRIYLKSIDRIG